MTAYPPERGRPGALARLAREDPHEMTAAARSSPMHVSSPQRWPLLARQQRPDASEDEITALAAELRAEHYRRIGETRRAARSPAHREATEIMDQADSPFLQAWFLFVGADGELSTDRAAPRITIGATRVGRVRLRVPDGLDLAPDVADKIAGYVGEAALIARASRQAAPPQEDEPPF